MVPLLHVMRFYVSLLGLLGRSLLGRFLDGSLSRRLLPRRRRQQRLGLDALDEPNEALVHALHLLGRAVAAARPADAAVLVDEVRVADLGVEQANRLADVVGDAAAHEKVLVPVALREALAQRAHKHAYQPGLAGIVLIVDAYHLREAVAVARAAAAVLLQDLLQPRVGRGRGKGVGLRLGPLAAEDGDDGGAAGEERSGVARLLVALYYGLAVEVGEEEGELGLEEPRWRDKGLAVVVFEIVPVAKVGS